MGGLTPQPPCTPRPGKCEPAPGSGLDDARLLPWRDMLEGALAAAYGMLRSPTEHESNALISSEAARPVWAWGRAAGCSLSARPGPCSLGSEQTSCPADLHPFAGPRPPPLTLPTHLSTQPHPKPPQASSRVIS